LSLFGFVTMARKSQIASPENQLDWLMAGDPAIRWQTMRDLLGENARAWQREQARVPLEGWGARLLKKRDAAGTWAGGLYSPKWTSTTYSLILLRRLGLPTGHAAALESCRILIDRGLFSDGGIDLSSGQNRSETCITGFVLALVTQLGLKTSATARIIDYLLREQMDDGGWNCQRSRGATHSSFHTTINVLEGLRAYVKTDGERTEEIVFAEARAREFFLAHRLYRSHRTGDVVNPCFTRFSFPPRWHHDVLRTLDYFRASDAPYDERLEDPITLLVRKRTKAGNWVLQNRHSGKTFFEMETVGKPSRWNTLRALRVIRWWDNAKENAK
jgi:hypothetical protein